MDLGAQQSVRSNLHPAWVAILTSLPAVIALLITTLLVLRSRLVFASFADPQTWNSLGLVALFIIAGLAVGYALRNLIQVDAITGARQASAKAAVPSEAHRDRLARYVVIAGTLSIAVPATALIAAVAFNASIEDDWEEIALSVFSSVLPVFATWVGTVLAFYFTNESFREAARNTQALAHHVDVEPITRPGTMVPFDRIVRIELQAEEIGNAGGDATKAAESIPLERVAALFKPPGIVRVVIFDDRKVPIFIIHNDGMPHPVTEGSTVKDYLKGGANRTSALNFKRVPSTATIQDGRRIIERDQVTDLFVTQNGRSAEPAIGWVPDDNLRKV